MGSESSRSVAAAASPKLSRITGIPQMYSPPSRQCWLELRQQRRRAVPLNVQSLVMSRKEQKDVKGCWYPLRIAHFPSHWTLYIRRRNLLGHQFSHFNAPAEPPTYFHSFYSKTSQCRLKNTQSRSYRRWYRKVSSPVLSTVWLSWLHSSFLRALVYRYACEESLKHKTFHCTLPLFFSLPPRSAISSSFPRCSWLQGSL